MRTFLFSIFFLPIFLSANSPPHFNPATVHVFRGTILSVQTFRYITHPTPHKQILLRTTDKEITVDLGPQWYLESQGITLIPEEKVEIQGSLILTPDSYFVIASSIKQGSTVYKLREKNGLPVWRGRYHPN